MTMILGEFSTETVTCMGISLAKVHATTVIASPRNKSMPNFYHFVLP
jgi:hypothetical protein